ncbi:hypothetical protein G2W53_041757 [Senna tora]|uniref:Uncharacterized protein n=1 Tax=Senna tora TaxID=362788 RepID=A0A834SG76_9FABA|nr:hypothetical protein G2W53_041757 [Senna tora]
MVLLLLLFQCRPEIDHHRSRRQHHHALLDPQNAQAIQAYSTPHPRDRSQRNVVVERLRPEAHGVVWKINVVGISYGGSVAYNPLPSSIESAAPSPRYKWESEGR